MRRRCDAGVLAHGAADSRLDLNQLLGLDPQGP